MSKRFSFTRKELDQMILEALEEKEEPQGTTPNVMKMLMEKAKLRKGAHAEPEH